MAKKQFDPSTHVVRSFAPRERRRVQMTFDPKVEPSKTKQQYAEQVDVNNIIKKYQKTGIITHLNPNANRAMFGDFTGVQDLQSAMERVSQAQASFMELPSHVRARFNNDPGYFLEFALNPENMPEMVRLGLATVPVESQKKADEPPAKKDSKKDSTE